MMAPLNIQVIAIHADGFSLAHEIGHAKFWLRHPDNDPDHLIPSVLEGETSPGVGPYKYNDMNNFMYHTSVGRVNRIRQYQWKKILTSTFND
ncbi:MAG: hypothetical protein H6567_05360 [Lewinellaceae bacterium]|nr:hypothetical protein [Lewinellaceae bacterium]